MKALRQYFSRVRANKNCLENISDYEYENEGETLKIVLKDELHESIMTMIAWAEDSGLAINVDEDELTVHE